MSAMLDVREDDDGIRLLSLSGRIHAGTEQALRAPLEALAFAPGQRWLLDLAGVALLDSMGIGLLGGLIRRAEQGGAHLVLSGPPPGVRRSLEIARFDQVVDILADAEAARRWLGHLAEEV